MKATKTKAVPGILSELDDAARSLKAARVKRSKLDAELARAQAEEAEAEKAYHAARTSVIKACPDFPGI